MSNLQTQYQNFIYGEVIFDYQEPLTESEKAVVRHIKNGMTHEEIALKMTIKVETVERHLNSVAEKGW